MARKREIKTQTETIFPFEIPVSGDLTARVQKISEQTGLSPLNLFQKWILQEESLIGLMQQVRGGKEQKTQKEQIAERKETPVKIARQPASISRKRKEAQKTNDPRDGEQYQKTLIQRAMKLKKEGMTFVKIAEIFNAENVQTMSGRGKWYPASLVRLLSSKA
jgi:hypothetical protein